MIRRIKKKQQTIFLTGNLIEGPTGRYTAYFDQFPELVAEGENENDAKKNLIAAFQEVLEYKKATSIAIKHSNASHKPVKHFELAIA